MEEKIFAKGKYSTIDMSKDELLGLLKELKERTGGEDILEAFEIMQDFADLDKFKILRDIYILELSGAFKEPIHIDRLYNEV